jgi:hypothetical protein
MFMIGWLLSRDADGTGYSSIKSLLGANVGFTGLLHASLDMAIEELEELRRHTAARFLDQLSHNGPLEKLRGVVGLGCLLCISVFTHNLSREQQKCNNYGNYGPQYKVG